MKSRDPQENRGISTMSTITCPICGRRITTSDALQPPTQCPACGAALLAMDLAPDDSPHSRDDSDTRPVPLDQFPTRPVPPPPSPGAASTAASTGGTDGTDSEKTRDLPISALPQPPTASASRLARGTGVVALIALLIVLVAGAALAVNGDLPFAQQPATPTATASVIRPTATPATVPYSHPGLYSIAYPTGWNKTERNNPPGYYSATFVNPHGGASLTVTLQQLPNLIDAATFDTDYLNGLALPTGTKPRNLSKPLPVTLAGQVWTEESADVAVLTSNGTQYAHAVAMTIYYKGYAYTTVRLVPVPNQSGAQSAFDVAEQASFQPILATFTFLG